MRYAILSDIHGNLEALQAVLADVRVQADAVLCLGDIVGYGADPTACLEIVAERAQTIIAGNHEHAVAGLLDLQWFNPYARAAALWTRERLDDDHRSYLGGLPLITEVDDATLVHASPSSPQDWEYLVTAQDGYDAFAAFQTRLCFVGHSHLPGVWSIGSTGPEHQSGAVAVKMTPGRRYIVNVGSVGQPRDRDPRAAYAVWDRDNQLVKIRRVTYDLAGAREKILAAALPRFLADRLLSGS